MVAEFGFAVGRYSMGGFAVGFTAVWVFWNCLFVVLVAFALRFGEALVGVVSGMVISPFVG